MFRCCLGGLLLSQGHCSSSSSLFFANALLLEGNPGRLGPGCLGLSAALRQLRPSAAPKSGSILTSAEAMQLACSGSTAC